MGVNSLTANTTGASNTGIGTYALDSTTTGNNIVAVGWGAGETNTTGAQNVFIGVNSVASAADDTYEIVIATLNTTGKGSTTGFMNANGGGNYAGNNSSSWSTTSDRRIKKNIEDNTTGLDAINQIRVRNFEYRTPDEITELAPTDAVKKEGVQVGVIAQEIAEILPDVVTQESTGVYAVDSDHLTWYLINAVKELSAEIEELKQWKKENTK